MNKLLPLLLGLAGVGLMTFLCASMHRGAIESDLTSKTTQQLAGLALPSVRPAAEGQIITLTGEVTAEEAKVRAGEEAAKVWGVSEVRNLITVLAPKPAAPVAPVLTPQQRTEAINCQGRFDEFLKEPIQFATGKAEISRASFGLLNRLANMAKTCPAAQFEVGGHTDPRGSREMNLDLSKRRAAAVVRYLAARGVDEQRMSSEGYGPDKPIADNKTAAGMRRNRRTEFTVKGI
jgi:OmpA-OmpF porin, OOP family